VKEPRARSSRRGILSTKAQDAGDEDKEGVALFGDDGYDRKPELPDLLSDPAHDGQNGGFMNAARARQDLFLRQPAPAPWS